MNNLSQKNNNSQQNNLSHNETGDKYLYIIYLVLLVIIGVFYFYYQFIETNSKDGINNLYGKLLHIQYLFIPYFFIAGGLVFLAAGVFDKFHYLKFISLLIIKILLLNIITSFIVLWIAGIPLINNEISSFFPVNIIGHAILSLASKFVIFLDFFFLFWGILFSIFPNRYFNYLKENYIFPVYVGVIFIVAIPLLCFLLTKSYSILFMSLILSAIIIFFSSVYKNNRLHFVPQKFLNTFIYLNLLWPMLYYYITNSNRLLNW